MSKEKVRSFLASMNITSPLGFAVYALIISTLHALMEEVVHRWFVFTPLRSVLGSSVFAAAGSSAVFAGLHMLTTRTYIGSTWLWALMMVMIFGAGLLWCGLVVLTGNVWAAFVSHILADATIFALMGSMM